MERISGRQTARTAPHAERNPRREKIPAGSGNGYQEWNAEVCAVRNTGKAAEKPGSV